VLIVDDAEDNRVVYGQYLEFFGLSVVHAVDGEHALFKIERRPPDVIVMDLAMPILDGWETMRRLKAAPQTADIPIIAVTGHFDEGGLRRAHAVGAYAVLLKPCLPEVLHSVIRGILERADRGSA
jgi:CheY-like chemotaxis protein